VELLSNEIKIKLNGFASAKQLKHNAFAENHNFNKRFYNKNNNAFKQVNLTK
jgi:hypothetical protein